MTGLTGRTESAVASGARWITAAFVVVGMLNYGYALLLTHLLPVAAYARFAAAQGLILWASTVATVCVPWVLAQALIRARSDAERHAATRFAKLVSTASGLAAAAIVGLIAARFAGAAAALALAVSTFIVFLGTTTTGWLQGRERMRSLAALYVAENLLKNTAGVLLVVVAGLGDTGALAAFGLGGIVMLVRWPRTPRATGQLWTAVAASRELWRRAARIACAQGIVSLFVAVDVVLDALLPGNRALAASYQASATLSRVPLFVASAIATAFFPSLSQGAAAAVLAARSMRMYAAVAVPLAAVLMTIPPVILAAVFPATYAAVATLLTYTAVSGLAVGAISLMTAFFQAADDSSCLGWLGAGLAGYVAALLGGWQAGGITGLAAGGAVGTAAAAVLLAGRLVRRQGYGVLARIPALELTAAAGLLVACRSHLLLWLAATALIGVRASARFLRPGARHARGPRWAAPAGRRSSSHPAVLAKPETARRAPAVRAADGQSLPVTAGPRPGRPASGRGRRTFTAT